MSITARSSHYFLSCATRPICLSPQHTVPHIHSLSTPNTSNPETRELPLCFIYLHNWPLCPELAHNKKRLALKASQIELVDTNWQPCLFQGLANGGFNLCHVTMIRVLPILKLLLIFHIWRSPVFIKLYLWVPPALPALRKGFQLLLKLEKTIWLGQWMDAYPQQEQNPWLWIELGQFTWALSPWESCLR